MRAACRGDSGGLQGPTNYSKALEKRHDVLEGCWVGRGHLAGERWALAHLSFAGCCPRIDVKQEFCQVWRQSTEVCQRLLAASGGHICPKIAHTAEGGTQG